MYAEIERASANGRAMQGSMFWTWHHEDLKPVAQPIDDYAIFLGDPVFAEMRRHASVLQGGVTAKSLSSCGRLAAGGGVSPIGAGVSDRNITPNTRDAPNTIDDDRRRGGGIFGIFGGAGGSPGGGVTPDTGDDIQRGGGGIFGGGIFNGAVSRGSELFGRLFRGGGVATGGGGSGREQPPCVLGAFFC